MRRLGLPLVTVLLLGAGCGGGKTVAPTAETVVGSLPKQTTLPKGDAAAGKLVYNDQGCGGCHTFKPAGSTQKVGPDLDNLAQLAQKANQGTLVEFVQASIVNPSAYVESGYPDVMPKDYGDKLNNEQLADLIAFLTQS